MDKLPGTAIFEGTFLGRMCISAQADVSGRLLWAGRLLLILLAGSLCTMPITQHYWVWDRFLQGGQDFEFGALWVLLFLSLAVILSIRRKQWIDLLFKQLPDSRHGVESGTTGQGFPLAVGFGRPCRADPALPASRTPLRI